jgi:hypothetical protein
VNELERELEARLDPGLSACDWVNFTEESSLTSTIITIFSSCWYGVLVVPHERESGGLAVSAW